MGLQGKIKKWKCEYCSNSIEADKVLTTDWIQVVLRDGKVVLTGCPEHSEKIRDLVRDMIPIDDTIEEIIK